jgi:crotonobetainyl-CoA:carnitine CoA-transferase CaiB-like acyl-CoA transferase
MTALDGLLVVALEQAVAAPLCTARLAAAGARVIKIERAEGDFARGYDHVVAGESAYFLWLNRGKQSIALDIKDEEDAALLHRLIAQADIFVQNLAPGAAARAGLGSEALRAHNPRLITCDISGYGDTGPYVDEKAYDLLIQCEAGLAAITGGPEGPARVGVSVADICCGMNAHAAILEALIARERTGSGASLSLSLFGGLAEWMTVPYLHQVHGGRAPARIGLHHASIAPYGAFPTADGKTMVLAVQNDREWRRLCRELLGDAGLAEDPRFATNATRVANRGALEAIVSQVTLRFDASTLLARLRDARIAVATVNDVAGLVAHPQLRTDDAQVGEARLKLPAHPWRQDGNVTPSAPAIDAHGAAIRAEFAA